MADGLVLGLIPARAGSKGVPDKNLLPLAGRTLLDYVAAAARASQRLDRLVLSTDSEAIAAAGRAVGLEVPFLRPPDLARDDTPMLPVVVHALDALERAGWVPEYRRAAATDVAASSRAAHRGAVRPSDQFRGQTRSSASIEVPRHFSPDYVMRVDDGVLRPFLPEGRTCDPASGRSARIFAGRNGVCVPSRHHRAVRQTSTGTMPPVSHRRQRIAVDRLPGGLGRGRKDPRGPRAGGR